MTEALDIHESDMRLMKIAIHEAQKSLSEGGVPVGAALARGDKLLASGHNERVQRGDPSRTAKLLAFGMLVVRSPTATQLCILLYRHAKCAQGQSCSSRFPVS